MLYLVDDVDIYAKLTIDVLNEIMRYSNCAYIE